MLGKASEIRFQHINVVDGLLQKNLDEWQNLHLDAIILDIKFSATAVGEYPTECHALIIYKEESA